MQSIVSRRKILIASLGAAAVGLTRTAQALHLGRKENV